MRAGVPWNARIARAFAFAAVLLVGVEAGAAETGAPPESASVAHGSSRTDSTSAGTGPERASLVVFGDTIAWFQVTSAGIAPARRAVLARERLEGLRSNQFRLQVHAEPLEGGYMVLLGEMYAFMFWDGDAAARPPAPGSTPVEQVERQLGESLAAQAHRLSLSQRLIAVGWTVFATIVLVLLLRLLSWAQRFAREWIERQSKERRTNALLGDMEFLTHFAMLISWLARAVAQIGGAVVFVIWAVFVLNRFPETQAVGTVARSTLVNVLLTFEAQLVGAVPGVIGVAVIVFVARFATRLAADVFAGIERGTLRLPGIHPETAGATRRLVTAAIWLFAVVVAYPLLPGSSSDAFKGVSVFLGLMVTLGSSGVMGHMMSGLVLVYSRSLRAGDVVRVNDIEGLVSEVGVLSVKVINSRKEEFTIPNAVIVGTTVKNYTRLGRDLGPVLTTGVTIGYDAPWRVVYELLLGAAARTAGVQKEPAPAVFQPELSDFFVVYQLTVRLEPGSDRLRVLTELHQNIQDAFNERGVQIMSPHFEGQPEGRVWVPKSRWNAAPEDAEARGGAKPPRAEG
jgi:small-conductance mechanosensitive channel